MDAIHPGITYFRPRILAIRARERQTGARLTRQPAGAIPTPKQKHVTPIRALIIDDESLARERIRSLLGAHDDVEVAGEARDGREAVHAIREHAPDLAASRPTWCSWTSRCPTWTRSA
jgi:hypothetical protein